MWITVDLSKTSRDLAHICWNRLIKNQHLYFMSIYEQDLKLGANTHIFLLLGYYYYPLLRQEAAKQYKHTQ